MKINQRMWDHMRTIAFGLILTMPLCISAADEQTFASPEAAVNALITATANHDTNALHSIFGPTGHDLVSPDMIQATAEYKIFDQRLKEDRQLLTSSPTSLTLAIGWDGWQFPIPLVKQDGQWFFDTAAGRQEILDRRIGMDEMGAINVCKAYVGAQYEYASQSRMPDGVPAYAQFLCSTPGTQDGLFWPTNSSAEFSPLGPLVAQARVDGYHRPAKMLNDIQAPYHGYYYKILTRQGKSAPGGKYNYIINGRMIAGFALVAWPAEWGNTGVMTFVVNHRGIVYQKNLGPKTAKIARGMTTYDPDNSWTPVR